MASYLLEDNDLIQMNLFQTQNGQTLINTFHYVFHPSGGPLDGPLALQSLITDWATDPTGFLQLVTQRQTSDLSYGFLTAQKIKPSRWRAEHQFVGGTGANPDDPLPQNVAVSLERWPLLARRGATGRVQVGGIVATDVAGGKLTNTSFLAFRPVADALKKTYSGLTGDYVPVLAHITPSGYSINEVVGAEPMITTRTMRRRTVGRGI